MSDPISSADKITAAVEYSLWAVGALVFWHVQFSATARARWNAPSPLAPWTITATHFFTMALCVIVGGWVSQIIVGHLSNRVLGQAAVDGDLWRMVLNVALQLGLLVGVIVALILPRPIVTAPEPPPSLPPTYPSPFLAAVGTCLIAFPVLTLLGYAWKASLQSLGFETPEQEMVDVFRQVDSPEKLILYTVIAVVGAPLTEEIIFRAGLFRYLRTRIPRWAALLIPAALFAAGHPNLAAFLPLFALGVIFSLAYERTGRISVTIMAHGLFNLHTILLIMAGVPG